MQQLCPASTAWPFKLADNEVNRKTESVKAGQDTFSGRRAGMPQGLTTVIACFLPILAITSMFPAVPEMIRHFANDPDASIKVPSMVTVPGLAIALVAPFVGFAVDKFGRRPLLLPATFLYSICGTAPFFLESLNAVYISRFLLGLCEAVILTTVTTLIADYWDDAGRRTWLAIQNLAGPALSSVVILFAGSLAAHRWNTIFLLYVIAFPVFVAMWIWLFEPAAPTVGRSHETQPLPAATEALPYALLARIFSLVLFTALLFYTVFVNGAIVWEEIGVTDPARIGQLTALPSLFFLVGAALFWIEGRAGMAVRLQIGSMLLFLGAGLTLIGVAQGTTSMVAGIIVVQIGSGMAVPTLLSWTQSRLSPQYRGRGIGIWMASFFFGQFLSPIVIGVARRSLGSMQQAFVLVGCIGVAVSLVALALAVNIRRGGVALHN